jgi:protein-S-isoprenylcysteine O-methyltransferase Ste14
MGRFGMLFSGAILTVAFVAQIVLSILLYAEDGNEVIRWVGWALLWLSAVFGWLPILTFKRLGGVSKGRSYMETTVLVDRGVYGIVRHPQYLAGVLLGIGLSLIAQHWLVGVLGAVVLAVSYAGTYPEESRLLEKFGDEYRKYIERVPRMNFVWGLVQAARRKGGPRG